MRFFLFLLPIFLLSFARLSGQETGNHYVQLTYANDYFTATDYYFTQGIRLEYGMGRHTFFVGQEGYTPTSIRADRILVGDRPYAGSLYLGARRTGVWGVNLEYRSEILAGVIGPWSLAAAEQKWIHRQTGNVEPMGWDFQIANDVLLNYQFNVDKTFYSGRFLRIAAGGEGRIGTYRTRLGARTDIELGLLKNGAGKATRFGAAFYLTPDAYIPLYDATLQGGLFNRSSPYTIPVGDVERVVGRLTGGIRIKLGRSRIDFSHTYLTREFSTGRPHAYGTATIRVGW
ncbi:MAG: lipid A deacylase LpxR family protein [Saprospiraceae bacterium]